ncbi:endonuclease Q family protein [Alkalihalobacillus pseudalcaliphilus]|uniref:endonuclease Q family protein n=1 Tax=Alkalihalobacillus pseudalcaliphilus TaxID=79884 RepID=UPI00064DCF3F|nr:endonuclease Q family protein [Alkalihalobacillus pseudalcaliphilus]KMK75604.1 hypothetical protein AB990_09970 [Alkalihalobacillus pseudalcaliphilus]
MNTYFADLHIHIGRTESGRPVKITGSKSLTIDSILREASQEKGLDLIGVIDCHVPEVIQTLKQRVSNGDCTELTEGGVRFERTTLLLGCELEINDQLSSGPIHVLAFLPTLTSMEKFSNWLSTKMKNHHLSSQRIYTSGLDVQKMVKSLQGLFIPAHIFTPFKSLYGSGVKQSLTEVFDPNKIDAVELGLSSDTKMAAQIKELDSFTFLTNSDAHSLGKIGREYQQLRLKDCNFNEFAMALKNELGRTILANYGLKPQIGKYHQTTCEKCISPKSRDENTCLQCGHHRFVKGVSERLKELSNTDTYSPLRERPPYIHQVPLEYLPGLGPKTLMKLKDHFGTEMNILHHVPSEQLLKAVPEKIAKLIIAARTGGLTFQTGGGGLYGKVVDQK